MADAKKTFTELCALFEQGDKPNEQAFRDWLYTMFNGKETLPGLLFYRALLSQNPPVLSQTSGTVPIGSKWTCNLYGPGDDFSNWELISGVVNTDGAVYRATVDAPTDWSNNSDLSYDGAPYIVSTDTDGNFAPTQNDLDGDPVYTYLFNGFFRGTLAGAFPQDKTGFQCTASLGSNIINVGWNDDDSFSIYTEATDNILYYTELIISVAP